MQIFKNIADVFKLIHLENMGETRAKKSLGQLFVCLCNLPLVSKIIYKFNKDLINFVGFS
jgi:hypothetical protein